jgi:hypothetical protein
MRSLRLSILGILYLAMIPLAVAAQSILGTPDAYLGQDPPGIVPKKFAPDILVDKGMMILGRIAITHDGREIIYDQAPAMYGTKDLVVKSVEFDGHVLGASHVLKFSHFVQDTLISSTPGTRQNGSPIDRPVLRNKIRINTTGPS